MVLVLLLQLELEQLRNNLNLQHPYTTAPGQKPLHLVSVCTQNKIWQQSFLIWPSPPEKRPDHITTAVLAFQQPHQQHHQQQ
jgi:hypothetical protein